MIHPLFTTLLLALWPSVPLALWPPGPLAFRPSGPLAPPPPPTTRYEFTELHMGMAVRLVLHAADEPTARRAARAGFDRIAALEDVFSDYRSESELRQLESRAIGGGWTPVSPELGQVLAAARRVAEASGGAFDPTVGPLVALWRESRRSGRLPDPALLAAARALVNWQALEVDSAGSQVRLHLPGMRLDLGGIAKGFILGQALAQLRRQGISSALIEAGGDIVLAGPPPGRPGWEIGVDGMEPGPLSNTAIATSGTGEQFVEIAGVRHAHIVDPRTGLGVTHEIQVTVIGPDPTLADALATALVILGEAATDRLLAVFPGYTASIVVPPRSKQEPIGR